MKKNKIIYITITLLLLSLLFVNTIDYFKLKVNISKKENDIREIIEKTENVLNKNDLMNKEYETIKEEKKEEIKELEKWKSKIEEIKIML